MADNNDKITLGPKKLQLTRVEESAIKQKISNNRSKTVVVEVKKTRTFSRKDGVLVEDRKKRIAAQSAEEQAQTATPDGSALNNDDVSLTDAERENRLRVLEEAEKSRASDNETVQSDASEDENTPSEEADSEVTAPSSTDVTEEAKTLSDKADAQENGAEKTETKKETLSRKVSLDVKTKPQVTKPAKAKKRHVNAISADDEYVEHSVLKPAKKKDTPADSKAQKGNNAASGKAANPAIADIPNPDDMNKTVKRTTGRDATDDRPSHAPKRQKGDDFRRNKGKLTIANAFDQEEKMRSLASIKRARQKAKRQSTGDVPREKTIREVVIPETISTQELANRLAIRSQEVTKELMKLGVLLPPNAEMDADTAELIVTELGHKFKRVTEADVEDILIEDEVHEDDLEPRCPVVTIMGHVDHGKTSLLDALRSSKVVDSEAGGITQHIAAYQVETPSGEEVTFLDTPGHAAFTAMRARGAEVTDIVVLIVAADDGIMPQTEEAISHAKAADVPIIVAINKIDKPDANPQKVKDQLLSYELIPEDLGGNIMTVEISAKQRLNLDALLEAISLQAEILELKASAQQRMIGNVIEARLDKNKGVITTILVQKGTLRIGDIMIAGTGMGRVKAMFDDMGRSIEEAGPSTPVQVLGLDETPGAGDAVNAVHTEKQAREIVEYRLKQARDIKAAQLSKASGDLDKLFASKDGTKKELRLIIKGDVHGSVEAIQGSLSKLENDEVDVKYIHTGSGAITDSDVTLAMASGATILGFNVRASADTKRMADDEHIEIRYYSIIYNLIDDMKSIIGGLMSPVIREEFTGNAKIQQIFKMSKYGKVAGCLVSDGFVKRGSGVRLIRDNVVIHEGKLKTLKRFKDDVTEVKKGMECGMAFENYEDIREGDVIEAFEVIEEQRVLD